MASSFLFVDVFRLLQLRFGDLESFPLAFNRTEKAGLITFVTCGANLLDLDEQYVAITIERDVFDRLCVAAFFALHPKFLARTAPEMRLAGGDGTLKRRAVHPREHHHPPGFVLLNDGWNQTIGVKFQLVIETH